MAGDENSSVGPNQWPHSLDAMTAAPEHHELLRENDRVRVLDTRLGPGERTPVQTHRWPSVHYVLSWSDIVRCDVEGNVLLDTRTQRSKPENGATLWSGPLGPRALPITIVLRLNWLAPKLRVTGGWSGSIPVVPINPPVGGQKLANSAVEILYGSKHLLQDQLGNCVCAAAHGISED